MRGLGAIKLKMSGKKSVVVSLRTVSQNRIFTIDVKKKL